MIVGWARSPDGCGRSRVGPTITAAAGRRSADGHGQDVDGVGDPIAGEPRHAERPAATQLLGTARRLRARASSITTLRRIANSQDRNGLVPS